MCFPSRDSGEERSMRESEDVERRQSQNISDAVQTKKKKKREKKLQIWCDDYLHLLDWFLVAVLIYTPTPSLHIK